MALANGKSIPKAHLSGGFTDSKTCAQCHEKGFPVGEKALLRRWSPSKVVGDVWQHHPEDRDCLECHRGADRVRRPAVPERLVYSTGGTQIIEGRGNIGDRLIHLDRNGDEFLRSELITLFADLAPSDPLYGVQGECKFCHWKETEGLNEGNSPESPRNRRELGNNLDRFMSTTLMELVGGDPNPPPITSSK